jgi:hypothetical protein
MSIFLMNSFCANEKLEETFIKLQNRSPLLTVSKMDFRLPQEI